MLPSAAVVVASEIVVFSGVVGCRVSVVVVFRVDVVTVEVEGIFFAVLVLSPPDVDVTSSVVVSFKTLVVVGGGVAVEIPGVVALNPFVFSLERSGAAKEEERGRRNRASIIIIAVVFTFVLFLNFCSLALLGTGGLLLLCQTRSGIYTAVQRGTSGRRENKDKSRSLSAESGIQRRFLSK